MLRELDTVTLANAAKDYAREFLRPTVANPHNPDFAPVAGRGWVMNSLYNAHFKDEHVYIRQEMPEWLGRKGMQEFDEEAARIFTPRSEEVFHHELARRLAITPDGKAIPGRIGLVSKHVIKIGWRFKQYVWAPGPDGRKVRVPAKRMLPRLVTATVYVGETEEEAAFRVTTLLQDHGEVIFPLSQWPATMALGTVLSNEAALGMCDYAVDRLDEGSGAAILRFLDGTKAADVDTAIGAQVTLAQLVYSDPAFGSAVDNNPGARATANAITSDASANATGTATWFRASATNDGATALDDHIDGTVGTSGCDANLNTTAFVSGATISVSSHTFDQPES